MALIARGTKSNGSTSLADGNDILAAELNADFDTVFDEVNGGLDATNCTAGGITNVAIGAGVDAAKIDDYSATVVEMRIDTSPGVSGSESQATTLEGELSRLRYVVRRIASGSVAVHNDGSTHDTLYWGDQTVRGANLVKNHSFEVKTTAAGAAPDGWTIFGTPTTLTQATTDTSNGLGKCISIVGDAATEGIYQTIRGLKASALYFVQARYAVTTGSMLLTTTGAIASGEWRDLSITKTGAGWGTVAGVVQTDSSGTDIVLAFVTTANGDAFKVDDVEFRELAREIVASPQTIVVRDSSTDTGAISSSEGVFPSGDALTAAVTVPCDGCTISVRAKACVQASAGSNNATLIMREALTIAATTSDVDIASEQIDTTSRIYTVPLGYVNTNPTPGETYTYSLRALGVSTNAAANGTQNGKVHNSWIEVTLHAPR